MPLGGMFSLRSARAKCLVDDLKPGGKGMIDREMRPMGVRLIAIHSSRISK